MALPGCLQVLAANQSPAQKKWFQGTADAVRQYLWLFENSMREGIEDFLILAGEYFFTMDTVCSIFRSLVMIVSPWSESYIQQASCLAVPLPPAPHLDAHLQGTTCTA